MSVAGIHAEESGRPSTVDVIIESAEKREESEMTVPIAITAFFEDLKIETLNIQNVTDLSLMTPGLEVRADGANNLFTMRGVGTSFGPFHANEPAVAVHQHQSLSVSLFGQSIFDERQIQNFEIDGFEREDPDTGEEVFAEVAALFISSYELWGWRYTMTCSGLWVRRW